MLRKVVRVVAITAWAIGASWGWIGLVFGCLMAVLKLKLGFWKLTSTPLGEALIDYGLFGCGTIFVTITALVLGMRGKLPGTAKKRPEIRGFSVTLPTSRLR